MPRALLRVSWYSACGRESATMPAPACTCTRQPPSGWGSTTMVRIVMAVFRAPARSTAPYTPE